MVSWDAELPDRTGEMTGRFVTKRLLADKVPNQACVSAWLWP
ncbi:Uncharacterised protein [Mycobacteroides abscessus subsp. abscessus]|nr:Uncharacterised protein [Mycobacteroides abscessus]CPZ74662.1 Uncharacterised protein [Mycobacteroides abscessus]SHW12849.1 Uncharacterised protein [Mycobacteroides abscessus subsp. abscessus]SIM24511.1 Uncharacterised protein [Mycobacteroides abscessus subsp. abscessus]